MIQLFPIRFFPRFGFLILAACCAASCSMGKLDGGPEVPPPPPPGEFTLDSANILSTQAKTELAMIQKKAFDAYGAPIVVVTLRSLRDYGGQYMSVEDFSKNWFNEWQISKKDSSGFILNKGMLLLVAVEDRQACITLGGDWGRRWDAHANAMLNAQLYPRFERKQFSEGVLQTVKALSEMARQNPQSTPANQGF